MRKFVTDMHTHSHYSHDGRNALSEMLEEAQRLGVDFYGISDHLDYDYDLASMSAEELAVVINAEPEDYFHGARHLQEDYEGAMNVFVGAEFGYSDKPEIQKQYLETYQKYRPDFVVNSVHGVEGKDFARYTFTQDKKTTYRMYLGVVRRSLDAPYPYDVIGHFGYVARYAPFDDVTFGLDEFGAEIDDILSTIIRKGKILEVNTATKHLKQRTLPSEEIVQRYYELGGRRISYGSDAHLKERITDKRDEVVETLKRIGFTHLTVPCKGEYIKVEI